MKFSDIPNRSNAARIIRGWFDNLRDAGERLENIVGLGSAFGTQAIANNQGAATNVTGLSFSSAEVRAAFIDFSIRRKTDSVDLVESGSLIAQYRASSSSWDLTMLPGAGDSSGVTFSITAAGQVQYVSDSQAGSYDTALSKMAYSARTVGV